MGDATGVFHIWNKLTDKLVSQIYSLIHNILKYVYNRKRLLYLSQKWYSMYLQWEGFRYTNIIVISFCEHFIAFQKSFSFHGIKI